MLNWDAPILAVHILLINLATDTLPALALGVDPASKNIMKNNPVGKDSVLLGKAIDDGKNKLYLKTNIGGRRIVNKQEGEMHVRICKKFIIKNLRNY